MVKVLLVIGLFLFVSGIISWITIDENVKYCFENPCGILPNNYSQGVGQLIYFVFGTGLGACCIVISSLKELNRKSTGKVTRPFKN